ncbi:MAG: exosortase/archaeosortase family protein [Candidatus Auribacterota bacterium]|jgi:exosortase|nr:exosortase/archaeosortase family protein [Candidatus Auribacterota bacterium]
MKKEQVFFLLSAIVFVAVYYPIWEWMYGRYVATDTYYSHGFLIPPISLFLLYRKRDALKKAWANRSSGGVFFLVIGIVMALLAAMWRFYFLGGLSMMVVLYGGVDYLFGKQVRKLCFFPILFLFFMVPIPEAWIAVINLKLKFFATAIAVKIVELTGILVVQEGSKLYIADDVMTVGDVCSGLRSLISLLAFGALFSYMCDLPLWKKWILFIMAFPCAIASNVTRIAALCFAAEWAGVPFATGKFHDYSGLGVFVVAFMILFGVEKILQGNQRHKKGSLA